MTKSGPEALRFAGLWATLTVSMSQHQLHNPAEARRALTQAREKMAVEDDGIGFLWHLRLLEQALLREAETLIEAPVVEQSGSQY